MLLQILHETYKTFILKKYIYIYNSNFAICNAKLSALHGLNYKNIFERYHKQLDLEQTLVISMKNNNFPAGQCSEVLLHETLDEAMRVPLELLCVQLFKRYANVIINDVLINCPLCHSHCLADVNVSSLYCTEEVQ